MSAAVGDLERSAEPLDEVANGSPTPGDRRPRSSTLDEADAGRPPCAAFVTGFPPRSGLGWGRGGRYSPSPPLPSSFPGFLGYSSRPVAIGSSGSASSATPDPDQAPLQGDEGAPEAWLAFDDAVLEALGDVRAGQEAILLTWLHRARRDVLSVRPRGDPSRPETGVFSTRSPDRPNPIGLHRVEIVAVEGRGCGAQPRGPRRDADPRPEAGPRAAGRALSPGAGRARA